MQDCAQCRARERALLMLKLMAEGERDIAGGDTWPQAEVFEGLRQQLRARAGETGNGQDG